MYAETLDFQLTIAKIHRRNKIERANHAVKGHFIAGLCTNDHKFPFNFIGKTHLTDHPCPESPLTIKCQSPALSLPK